MSISRQTGANPEPIFVSRAMRNLDKVLRKVAAKDVTVCLIGESGSGKEVLARRLHELSSRRARPFVPINCAAIPEGLFESELFGYEKGAFTGASKRTRGKIEAAEGGVLFLDEIAEMPLGVQAKLLRFLENRKFMRVGGTAKIAVDVRLISATLRPLEEEIRRGRFRSDLFFRTQGVTLTIPPLRDRRADIAPLLHQHLEAMCTKHRLDPPRLSRAAMFALTHYNWPGNVRELRNVIESVAVLCSGHRVQVRDLPESIQTAVTSEEVDAVSRSTLRISLEKPLEEIVDEIIWAAVEAENGNKSRAASRLGIGLRTLQRRFTRMGLLLRA